MEPTVKLTNIRRAYSSVGNESAVLALDDISLQIEAGESMAIVGQSGAGKTTLLQIIAGFDKPTAGEVRIAGQNIQELNDTQLSRFRNQTIGFVFQFFNLQNYFTAQENVAFPLLLAGEKKTVAMKRAYDLLVQVGLEERANHFPSELSGGEMQRVAIARALVNNPRVILADEPTANLDERNAAAIINLLKQVATKGVSLIVITHDSRISNQFDRVLCLKGGKMQ